MNASPRNQCKMCPNFAKIVGSIVRPALPKVPDTSPYRQPRRLEGGADQYDVSLNCIIYQKNEGKKWKKNAGGLSNQSIDLKQSAPEGHRAHVEDPDRGWL